MLYGENGFLAFIRITIEVGVPTSEMGLCQYFGV